MVASQQHYWEMGIGEWVTVAYLAYLGETPLPMHTLNYNQIHIIRFIFF